MKKAVEDMDLVKNEKKAMKEAVKEAENDMDLVKKVQLLSDLKIIKHLYHYYYDYHY